MLFPWFNILLLILNYTFGLASSELNSTDVDNQSREKRIFSIFSIVQFANVACTSTQTLSGGIGAQFRNGTCLTNTECGTRGGMASGNCAGGFGVCCVFMTSTCGSAISQNCTYIKNPNFPNPLTETTACSFTLNKCEANICDMRLDFEMFTTNGPALTTEANGGVCQDMLTTTTSNTAQIVPVICGLNTGQHIYLDVGREPTNSATLAFTFSGTFNRVWDIKVTQIPCNADFAPRNGCLQYHTGIDGRLTSFNFLGANQHLANQDQRICIRREKGYCCIAYSVCADTSSMSLNTAGTNTFNKAAFGTACTEDFLMIEGSSPTGSRNLQNRYCGGRLASLTASLVNDVIRDCTTPFEVGIRTDGTADAIATNVANGNRGLCLNYVQEPCQSLGNSP